MSYEPHEWVAGETVTASKLNNMEQGIANGGGILVATLELPNELVSEEPHRGETKLSEDNGGDLPPAFSYTITSHTWQELYDAVADGSLVFLRSQYEYSDDSGDSEEKKGQTRDVETFYNYIFDLVRSIGKNYNDSTSSEYYYIDLDSISLYCSNPDDYPSSNNSPFEIDSGGIDDGGTKVK